jgi:hypothetical protein
MDANRSVQDRFREDKGGFPSIPVRFRPSIDGDRRCEDPDRRESAPVVVEAGPFRPVEERNRHNRVPFGTKSAVERAKAVRSLVEIVAFMSKAVPLRAVEVLFREDRLPSRLIGGLSRRTLGLEPGAGEVDQGVLDKRGFHDQPG